MVDHLAQVRTVRQPHCLRQLADGPGVKVAHGADGLSRRVWIRQSDVFHGRTMPEKFFAVKAKIVVDSDLILWSTSITPHGIERPEIRPQPPARGEKVSS